MTVTQRDERSFQVDLTSMGRGFWGRLRRQRVRVDPYQIAKAVFAVMDFCGDRDVRGQRLMWNDYRIFLSQSDYDGLAPLIGRLEQDLASLLQERFNEGDAALVGGLNVDLLVSEGERLAPGTVVVQAQFLAWKDEGKEGMADGAVTVRAGRRAAQPPPLPSTRRVADPVTGDGVLQLKWLDQHATVGNGLRVVLGRPHADATGSFVPLHGASNEINRRQLFIEPSEGGGAVIGRLTAANSVQVNGRLVQPGGQIAVPELPVEVSLSNGALVLRVEAAQPA
ncbi:MAG TPA: DUF2662 domain-containing protein [Deltaproteobacteria bacterium]|nr:DUF2662 domain-containing protein [Deltaproteobacteria bacterium]